MSAALSEASTPAQDGPPIDLHNQQLASLGPGANDPSLQGQQPQQLDGNRKPKAPSVRRACAACHAGKTRCSESLPCQSCIKRGLRDQCSYPSEDDHQNPAPQSLAQVPPFPAAIYTPPMQGLAHQYIDYNGTFSANPNPAPAPAPSTSTFRPSKRPRLLTEEETAAITRNFTRGDFFVGSSAPVRIDPRLPVRLTLAEGDQVHFSIGEAIV